MMIDCPYPNCTFQAKHQFQVDDHVIYMSGLDDESHQEPTDETLYLPLWEHESNLPS